MVQEIATNERSGGDGIFPRKYDISADGVKETIDEGCANARTSPGRIGSWHEQ